MIPSLCQSISRRFVNRHLAYRIPPAGTLLVCVSLISACSKWPPSHEELAERFSENRDAFEQLEAKILDTHYVEVSGGCFVDSNHEKISNRVTLLRKVDESDGKAYLYEQEYIEDDEWSDLFCQTLVWSVANYDGIVSFDFGSGFRRNNKTVFAAYTHSRELLESRKPCLPEHIKIPCGLCSVALDDEWYIEYWWSPEELVPGGFEQVLDEEMTEEEYRELLDRDLEQCRTDGLVQIGYDRNEFRQDESKSDQISVDD
jgi:hypothetical protein